MGRNVSMVKKSIPTVDEIESETFLDIVGAPSSESHWQSLLAYFIDPEKPHGFETDVLAAFLEVIADADETQFNGVDTRADLIKINVDTEQHVSDVDVSDSQEGQVDVLLWLDDKWLLCIELKVNSAESANQTVKYATASEIGGINLDEFDGTVDYLYIKPYTNLTYPNSELFTTIAWRDIADGINEVIDDIDGSYPLKYSVLLDEFVTHISEWGHIPDCTFPEAKSDMESYKRRVCKEIQGAFFSPRSYDDNRWKFGTQRNSRHTYFSKYPWREIACTESACTKPDCTSLIEYEFHLSQIEKPNPLVRVRLDVENHDGCERHRNSVINDLAAEFQDSEFYNEPVGGESDGGDYSVAGQDWNEMPESMGHSDWCWLYTDVDYDYDNPEDSVVQAVKSVHQFHSEFGDSIDDIVSSHNSI